MRVFIIVILLLIGLKETYSADLFTRHAIVENDDLLKEEPVELLDGEVQFDVFGDDPELMDKLRQISGKDLENAKQVMEEGWDSATVLVLAALPEEDVYLYGYHDAAYGFRGVIIKVGENVNCFDWWYITPQLLPPKIGYEDYDDDGQKELAVSIYIDIGTGFGFPIGDLYLYVLEPSKDGTLTEYLLSLEDYLGPINERLTYALDSEAKSISLYEGNHILQQADISWADEMNIEGIHYGDIVGFDLEDRLILNIEPGIIVDEWATPQYEGLQPLHAVIRYCDGKFELGEIY